MKAYITKRSGKRGTVWYGRIDLPTDPVTGKRRQKRFNAPTKREVEAMAVQLLAAIENGGFSEADAKKITVSEYLTRWIASIEGAVRPSTKARYEEIVKRHIEPSIGRVQLAKLSPLNVQQLYADRLEAGLSPTTVDMLHNILHKAIKQAVRWGLLTRNVTEAVDAPRRATPEYTTWNEQVSTTFLAVADGDELAALWRLALLTGLRRGEMFGLKWEDIDLTRGSLSVRRTLSRGNKGTYTFGMPKTAHGRRSIALPRSVVEALHKHRVRQIEHRLALGVAYQDQGLVFADAIGEPLHPNTVTYQFKRLCRLAGVPIIRIHDLRHTSATLMLANNVHPKIVQERLGHANISMTLDRYSHVTMDMQKDAADQLDDLLNYAR
jgi:integrase